MTAPLRRARIAIDPVAVLIARVEARAILWREGELTLHDAVDQLLADAERDGLVGKLGADRVQQILADGFAPVRDDLPGNQDVVPDEPITEEPTTAGVAASTLDAAEFLIRERDPKRLRVWLAQHSAEERRTILKHLERQKARRK
jgi:hypothetical protein